jgi:outer membrane lipoprotein
MRMKNLLLGILMMALLTACGSQPVNENAGPTPVDVRDSGVASGEVYWGGQIVRIDNLSDRTLIEVLALPLDDKGVPRTDGQPQGRFIVDKSGFLEPQQYAAGRLIEVRGQLNGFTDGKVGDADYRYPVVLSERVTLIDDGGVRTGPRVYPSIGVGVGSGGSSWGGVGVNIGF